MKPQPKTELFALLILAVTSVALAMLLVANLSPFVAVVVLIVEVVLIMVVGGAARHLPATLRAIRDLLRRRT